MSEDRSDKSITVEDDHKPSAQGDAFDKENNGTDSAAGASGFGASVKYSNQLLRAPSFVS